MRPNKLEQLFLTSISSLVNDLHIRVEPTLVDPLLSRLLTLQANVRQVWKGLPGSNALHLFGISVSEEEKQFYRIGTRGFFIRTNSMMCKMSLRLSLRLHNNL